MDGIVFRKPFECGGEFFSPSGTEKQPVFQAVKDENSDFKILKKIGEKDIYGCIQSYRDVCDVKRIVERYLAGDTSALQRMQALYFDATEMPGTMAEAYQKIEDLKATFEHLIPEAREYYGDPLSYIQRVASGDIFEVPVTVVDEGVVVNE